MNWDWDIVWDGTGIKVLRARPTDGQELEALTYGDDLGDGWVRTYTVAYCKSGTVFATWGDGSQSVLSGWGPNLGRDPHEIPAGRVHYVAGQGVEFYCVHPDDFGAGRLDHTPYSESTTLTDTGDSWVLVWEGQITVEGRALGEIQMVHIGEDRPIQVVAQPGAFYVHIRRR